MDPKSTSRVSVVIPNWNGLDTLAACLDSLRQQSYKHQIIVVENGSTDGSLEMLQANYPEVNLVIHQKNLGFAGGVNAGIRYSLANDDDYIALFNNDAEADPDWLKHLVTELDTHPEAGIATCTFTSIDKQHLDSTGDIYTTWGLPYPRGRGEPIQQQYNDLPEVFGASGGASLYRSAMLKQIGLFDEDFFAYYEDVDLSFRAQLAGWKVRYVPAAIAYHHLSLTSNKIKGFTTYQTMKNLPWVLYKNAPASVYWRILPGFTTAYLSFFFSAIARGAGWPALKGLTKSLLLLPKKAGERWHIQHTRQVTASYIWSILVHDLPPNAHKLRKLFHPFRPTNE